MEGWRRQKRLHRTAESYAGKLARPHARTPAHGDKECFKNRCSVLTSANCSVPAAGTKRQRRGAAESDIYFSIPELMVGCIIIQQPSLNHRRSLSASPLPVQSFSSATLNSCCCCCWNRLSIHPSSNQQAPPPKKIK